MNLAGLVLSSSMRFLLLLITITILPNGLSAIAPSKPITCSRHYVIGTNLQVVAKDQPPIATIANDLLNEIKRRIPCILEEKPLSFTRAAEDLKARRIDLYAFTFTSSEWESFTDHDILYSAQRLLLVDKKYFSEKKNIRAYLDDPRISFGILSGGSFFTSSEEIQRLSFAKRAVFFPYPDDILKKLELGLIGAAFTSATYFASYANKRALLRTHHVIADPQHRLNLSLFYAKERINPKDRALFQQAIAAMRTDGAIEKILRRYISKEDVETYYKY